MKARLQALRPEDITDPELRRVMEALGGDEAVGVYARAPELFKAFLAFLGPAKYGGRLAFPLKELVRLRIAELNDCER